jgi:hypothetical protein
VSNYPFINKHEACKILNCSESTLRRRMKTDLYEGIHWVQRSRGSAISFNQRLLEDYMAHLSDRDLHVLAIEAYQAHLKQNQPRRKRTTSQFR